jgi:hypothetical protein
MASVDDTNCIPLFDVGRHKEPPVRRPPDRDETGSIKRAKLAFDEDGQLRPADSAQARNVSSCSRTVS